MSNRFLILLGIFAVLLISYFIYSSFNTPISTSGSGNPIDISGDPIQITDTVSTIPPLQIGKNRYFFTIKAQYTIRGLLVSKCRYARGFWSKISPYDYAIAWGDVPNHMKYLKFSQTHRYCLYNFRYDIPIAKSYIDSHMSNNHLIAANSNIRKAFKKLKKGNLIEIEGYLVYVMGRENKRGSLNWNSSLTRLDTGDGACEILFVTKLRTSEAVYE